MQSGMTQTNGSPEFPGRFMKLNTVGISKLILETYQENVADPRIWSVADRESILMPVSRQKIWDKIARKLRETFMYYSLVSLIHIVS